MKLTITLAASMIASGAFAQTMTTPPDLSSYAKTTDVAAAITASTPPDCPAPLSDALVATAGTQSKCMPRQDAQRAAVIQATSVLTTSDGSFSGNWPAPFSAEPTARIADIDVTNSTSAPYKCSFIAGGVTATSFSGHCWQIVASTLPTTLTAVLGLVVSPLNNAASGLTVRVTGRK